MSAGGQDMPGGKTRAQWQQQAETIERLHEAAQEMRDRYSAKCAENERLDAQLQEMTGNKSQADETIMMLQEEIERLQAQNKANADHARLANENMGAVARSLKVERAENKLLNDVYEAAKKYDDVKSNPATNVVLNLIGPYRELRKAIAAVQGDKT